MIENQDIVYYGPEPWDGMWRNRHQLLTRLAQSNRVLYVQPRLYSNQIVDWLRSKEIGVADLFRDFGPRQVRERLWVYDWPRFAPIGGGPLLRPVTHALRRRALRTAIARLGMRDILLWFSRPDHADDRFDLPAKVRIYHIVDDYLAYHGLAASLRPMWEAQEQTLINWADLVVAVSVPLMESKGSGNTKFRLLPNAVDPSAYIVGRPASPPQVLAQPSRPILGYIGLIGVRLDLTLLDALAARRPDWTFVLIGEINREGCADVLDRLGKRENVRLLPAVPANEVPAYVAQFDLGLVPYRLTDETYHASPLKIYEYLAAGLPVVSSDVPGARLFEDVLAIAGGVEQWEAAIAAQLANKGPLAEAARREAVIPHSWDARVETLSNYLSEVLRKTARRGAHQ